MVPVSTPVALSSLAVGSSAILHDANLDLESTRLLRALGLSTSGELRLCKAGQPCIVQVGATRIAVSYDVAARILVIPSHPAAG
jgi:hypothetical protein